MLPKRPIWGPPRVKLLVNYVQESIACTGLFKTRFFSEPKQNKNEKKVKPERRFHYKMKLYIFLYGLERIWSYVKH